MVGSEAIFCALRWTTILYGLDHGPSRFIGMLRATDTIIDKREMAHKGLSPHNKKMTEMSTSLVNMYYRSILN